MSSNPYGYGSIRSKDWFTGWRQAEADYIVNIAVPNGDFLGRHLSELLGAVSFYLGDIGSFQKNDKARLRRAMERAAHSPAFKKYMEEL